jgi:lipopolysaccharide export system protein LptC
MAARRVAQRRWVVAVTKRFLPVAALALLTCVALWPQLARDAEHARLSYRRDGAPPQSGQMTGASYHGVDANGRPYTITAATAHQVDPERIDLTEPKADLSMESGNWLYGQSHKGVYLQHLGNLDVSDDVELYRDDGTTLSTSSASLDMKAGAAAGAEQVHVEGPFGTLDAQGFAITDRGAVIQFTGPGRLLLNSAQSHAAAPPPAPSADVTEPAEHAPEPPTLR